MKRFAHALLIAGMATFGTLPIAAGAAYPDKTIRIIVPFSPGGATDVLARALSDKLTGVMGVSVIVDNRPGAGGTLGAGLAARAAPDGYTLLLNSPSHTFVSSVYKNLNYDPANDFKPITMFAEMPNVLVVHPSMPTKNVKQLLALARKHPGEVRAGSTGRGGNIHLTTELFAHMAKIKLQHVPYKGGGPAMTSVISGETQLMFAGLQPGLTFIRSGRLRALAVTTKTRSPAAPDIPTIDESGVPGFDKAFWAGLFAPAGVPDSIVNDIHQAALKVLKDPEIAKRLANEGSVIVGNSPREFDAFIRSEIESWEKLIRELKI
jgi:tripartite-type tricarboxylate transporter receptor subunit TctC